MTDALPEVPGTSTSDIAEDKAARKQRRIRIFKIAIGVLYLVLVASAAYVTVRYP
jgi:hypothetical protein